jgi:hypothetical protein
MRVFREWGLTLGDICEAAGDGGCGRRLGNKFTLSRTRSCLPDLKRSSEKIFDGNIYWKLTSAENNGPEIFGECQNIWHTFFGYLSPAEPGVREECKKSLRHKSYIQHKSEKCYYDYCSIE